MSYINRSIRALLTRCVLSSTKIGFGRSGSHRFVATTSRLHDENIYSLSSEIKAAVERRGSFIV